MCVRNCETMQRVRRCAQVLRRARTESSAPGRAHPRHEHSPLDALDLVALVAELEDIAGEALDREILIHGPERSAWLSRYATNANALSNDFCDTSPSPPSAIWLIRASEGTSLRYLADALQRRPTVRPSASAFRDRSAILGNRLVLQRRTGNKQIDRIALCGTEFEQRRQVDLRCALEDLPSLLAGASIGVFVNVFHTPPTCLVGSIQCMSSKIIRTGVERDSASI